MIQRRLAGVIVSGLLLLTACMQQAATPSGPSDAELATKVALANSQLTSTSDVPRAITATPGLPTLTNTPPANAPTLANTAVGTPAATPAGVTPPAPTETILPATGTSAPLTQTREPATPTATRPSPTATQPPATPTPATPTATFLPGDPRAKLGNPTWTDKMNGGDNWPTGTDPSGYTAIAFQNGAMELTSLKPVDGWRLTVDKLSNAYLELTINSGACLPKDRYGVVVRVPSTADANRGYLLGFTCDGKYAIRKWDGSTKTMSNLINWKTGAAILAGANKTNRMGIMMQGGKLSLYANGTLLGEVQDSSWTSGYFGIFAGAHESSQYTLKVDEASYWKLP